MAKVDVKCPFCEQTESVKKHGQGKTGHQRYCCQLCRRTFQLDYTYRACQPGMKEQIVDKTTTSSSLKNSLSSSRLYIPKLTNNKPPC